MSRTLTAGLSAHLAAYAQTPARMMRLDLVDGSTIAVTDHNNEVPFDLGDGSAVYSPETGYAASDISLSTGFDPDDVEVSGPLVETATEAWHVTKTMVAGGRLDDAGVRIFEVDWNDLDGPLRMLKGYVTRAEVVGDSFKLTVHSEITRFAQEVGRTITPYCDADFGDARCGFTPITDAVTVTAVTNERQFTVSNPNGRANDFFNRGTVAFTSGDLNGCRPVEVFDWSVGGLVALWTDLPEPPQVGDTLNIRQGCYDPATGDSKTRAACLFFDNVVNFRGFPDVPGSDQVLRYPNPGG